MKRPKNHISKAKSPPRSYTHQSQNQTKPKHDKTSSIDKNVETKTRYPYRHASTPFLWTSPETNRAGTRTTAREKANDVNEVSNSSLSCMLLAHPIYPAFPITLLFTMLHSHSFVKIKELGNQNIIILSLIGGSTLLFLYNVINASFAGKPTLVGFCDGFGDCVFTS